MKRPPLERIFCIKNISLVAPVYKCSRSTYIVVWDRYQGSTEG